MFAWNECGESGYLEPDELYEFKMLEAVRDALNENNEFPEFKISDIFKKEEKQIFQQL